MWPSAWGQSAIKHTFLNPDRLPYFLILTPSNCSTLRRWATVRYLATVNIKISTWTLPYRANKTNLVPSTFQTIHIWLLRNVKNRPSWYSPLRQNLFSVLETACMFRSINIENFSPAVDGWNLIPDHCPYCVASGEPFQLYVMLIRLK